MTRPVPAAPPPAPVAQRLVIRYSKSGRMRFASHRDIARAVERGVRKAGLPVAYSAGFSPHPKISYAGGAPTGTASEAEYLEIALTGECAAPDVRHRLNAALPDGIDVIEVLELGGRLGGDGGLRLEGSQWRVVLPGVAPAEAARAAQAFLAAASVMVERSTGKGTRRLDARAAVVTLGLDRGAGGSGAMGSGVSPGKQSVPPGWHSAAQDGDAGCAVLHMAVRHLTPAVRPDDILAALSTVAALAPSSPPLVTRLAQGPLGVDAGIEGAGDGAAAGTAEPGLPDPAPPRPDRSAAPRPAAAPPAGPAAAGRVPQRPGPAAAQRQEKETRMSEAAAAAVGDAAAPATPFSAYEQLPRGAEGPDSGPRAREYDGRLPGCSKPSGMTENQTTMGRPALATPLA
jgi:radical SAM-linked protein